MRLARGVLISLPNMEKSLQSLKVGEGIPIHAEHYHFDCFDAGFFFGGGRGQATPRSTKMLNHCVESDHFFSLEEKKSIEA